MKPMRQKPQQIWQQKTQISPQLFLLSHQIKQLLQQWPGHLAELARSTETGPTGVKKSISLHNYIRIRQQIVLLIQINLICLIAIKKLPANLKTICSSSQKGSSFSPPPSVPPSPVLFCSHSGSWFASGKDFSLLPPEPDANSSIRHACNELKYFV